MSEKNISIPLEVLRVWECEADQLTRKIERDITLLSELKKRLASVDLMSYRASTGRSIDEMSAPEAVLFALSQFDAPISLHRLREYLGLSGFPMERFGKKCAHFYVVIRRLARQGKVRREGDEIIAI
jgi:hypothetical protein